MKKICFLLLIAFLGCKDKNEPEPFTGDINSVVKEFKIVGVSDENIKMVDNQVFVTLPAGYAFGDVIKPTVKLNNQFQLVTDISQGLEFEARPVGIQTRSSVHGNFDFRIHVIPADPFKIVGAQKDIDITIDQTAFTELLVTNVGSYPFANESGKLSEDVQVILTDQTTGAEVFSISTALGSDSAGASRLAVYFPVNTPAGNFKPVIKVGEKKVDFPKLINVKYGDLNLDLSGWKVYPANRSLSVRGYNILPDAEYTMEIENDFVPARKIKLTWEDHNNLNVKLPADMPFGNYRAKLFVNGKEYGGKLNPRLSNLNFIAFDSQPYIVSLSQPSLLQTGECKYYKETKTLARSQDILANTWFTTANENSDVTETADFKLKLVNRETKKEHLLNSLPARFYTDCFFQVFTQFPIPTDVSSGKYEVYLIVTVPGATPRISEALGEIVTIE
ncbi:hypothetical protein [Dyadobacter sp. CY323]|uniref:hypothetical protein n=1 Tax=Dyadobacter sp. CY323 TaxID=2907302 RepID=UPI001F30DB59|nr:hypothetical protein [Dyadobacter sp. CY323]MCE6990996.1 hypothetical protein [Dyadobacter sp. CY323]